MLISIVERDMESAMGNPGSLQGLNDLQHCITQMESKTLNGGNSSGFSAELRFQENDLEWVLLCSVSVASTFCVLNCFEVVWH